MVAFFDTENIDEVTEIMILCQLELDRLSKLDFYGGYFKKLIKPIFRHNCCSGNIANITPS